MRERTRSWALKFGQQIDILQRLGLEAVPSLAIPALAELSRERDHLGIPTFRVDLECEIDLIEEVTRLTAWKGSCQRCSGAIGSNEFEAVHDAIAEARRILAGLGLNEAQGRRLFPAGNFAFTIPNQLLDNPLSADMDMLRPTLPRSDSLVAP
jgi:phenylalanyl-tRNA synthetase beta subunit